METALAFDPSCWQLILTLQKIALEELPKGWTLRPFGSFISDTGLAPAILDLALVKREPPGLEMPPAVTGIVNEFVRVLRRRAGGAGPSLTLSQDTISPGFRLVASNFGGPHGGRQEIAIFEGDEHTGVIDSILRDALSLTPHARPLIRRVKLWVRCRCLHLRTTGLHNWTLLVVFFLQQKHMLPPLQQLPGSSPADESVATTEREIRRLLGEFAQFSASLLSRPHPRSTINIWNGKLVAAQVEQSAEWSVLDERVVVQELMQLHQAATGNTPCSQPFQPLRGRLRQDHDPEGRMAASHSTPPPVSRPEGRLSAVHLHGPVPKLPGAGSSAAEPEAGYMSDCFQAADFAEPSDLGDARMGSSPVRWHIDQSWTAHKSRGGTVVVSVKLDKEAAGELTREGWAKRFNRREYQIRIGKATREYRRWSAHAFRHGRSQDHPTTPRAGEQTTKKDFEIQYARWRVKLHQPPR
mmetsp:Transcript_4628/g.10925  ORF Transcript_4628/g.10925 Transcript_4628/m.10925 type:complete len:468 (-) Transcript_4628:255-1658(-)|eukprot:s6397_g1.t1